MNYVTGMRDRIKQASASSPAFYDKILELLKQGWSITITMRKP